jgi:hypothetical protein
VYPRWYPFEKITQSWAVTQFGLQPHALGNSVDAFTYCATSTDPSLLPHSWYLNHVIVGAKETGVPADYLEAIAATRSQEDPDRKRDARERAIYD